MVEQYRGRTPCMHVSSSSGVWVLRDSLDCHDHSASPGDSSTRPRASAARRRATRPGGRQRPARAPTQRSLSLDRILDLRATSRSYLTFCNGRHCCHYEIPAFHCQASSLLPFRLHLLLSFSALYESFDRSTFASRTVAGFSSVLKTVQMLLTQWRSLVSVWRSPKNT